MNITQDNKRYLVYKNTIYVPSILVDGTNIWAPLENSTVALSQKELAAGADKVKIKYMTKAYAEELIKSGIATAHKQIAGTALVTDMTDAGHKMTEYNKGIGFDIIGPNGNMIHYDKTVAVPGDIIIITLDRHANPQGTFKTEEAIILTNKDADLLTHNNENAGIVGKLDSKVTKNTNDIVKNTGDISVLKTKTLTTDNNKDLIGNTNLDMNTPTSDVKIATRGGVVSMGKAFKTALQGNSTKTIENLDTELATADGRLSALEQSAKASSNLWLGKMVMPGTGDTRTMDASQMKGDDGKFRYTELKDSFTVTLKNKKNGDTDTEQVIVSTKGTTDHKNGFSLKKTSDDIDFSIDGNGLVTMHKINGNIHLDDVEIVRVRQDIGGLAASAYTKSEAATEQVRVDGELNKKQNKVDQSLATNSKSITGAINELDGRIQTNLHRVDALNQVKVDNANTDLDGMDGSTAAKTLTSKKYVDESMAIINLSKLNPKEISAALPAQPDNKYYLIKHTNGEAILTYTMLSSGNKLLQGMSKDGFQYVLLDHTSTATPALLFGALKVGNPIGDDYATTKKYVDTHIAGNSPKTITLHFTDGTHANIKVG